MGSNVSLLNVFIEIELLKSEMIFFALSSINLISSISNLHHQQLYIDHY